jgi:hypothetical protein
LTGLNRYVKQNIAARARISSTTSLAQQSTSPATLHHDDVLAGEQHNAPAVSAVITQPENTPETENVSVAMVREHHRRLKKNYCTSLVHSQMH